MEELPLFPPGQTNKPDRNKPGKDEHLFDLCIETTTLASIYGQQNEIWLIGLVCCLLVASILRRWKQKRFTTGRVYFFILFTGTGDAAEFLHIQIVLHVLEF